MVHLRKSLLLMLIDHLGKIIQTYQYRTDKPTLLFFLMKSKVPNKIWNIHKINYA